MLGINDCFGLKADDPQAARCWHRRTCSRRPTSCSPHSAKPLRAELGVCLTTPPNIRDAAFVANYKTAYPRWNWRQVQHRIVERQLEHFGRRESEGIFVVPTELNLDIVGGYPENNAVHPNATGYQQIARASTLAQVAVRRPRRQEKL